MALRISPEALGLRMITEQERPEIAAACVPIARRIHHSGRKAVGLLPASQRVAVPAVAIQLGLALSQVTGGAIAYLDANRRWPGLPDAVAQLSADERAAPFVMRWLDCPPPYSAVQRLAIMVPSSSSTDPGAGTFELERALRDYREDFAHILVDLTGFERLGDHLTAASVIGGIVLVARARTTREQQLRRLCAELGPAEILGVLVTGTAS